MSISTIQTAAQPVQRRTKLKQYPDRPTPRTLAWPKFEALARRWYKIGKSEAQRFWPKLSLHFLFKDRKIKLFREQTYPSPLPAYQLRALDKMAMLKAKSLNRAVVSMDGLGEPYGKPLQALGGPSPWEYVDSAGGINRNGIFTIKSSRYLFPQEAGVV